MAERAGSASSPPSVAAATEAPRRRRRLSLRWRIVLAATAVVAMALGIGSAVFVGVLRESLVAGVQLRAERDAAEFAGQVETAGLASVDTDIDDDDGQIVQLLAADGSVLRATDNADDGPIIDVPAIRFTDVPLPDRSDAPSPSPSGGADDSADDSGRGAGGSDKDEGEGGDSGDADDSSDDGGDSSTSQPSSTPIAVDDSVTRTVTLPDGSSFVAVGRTATDATQPAQAAPGTSAAAVWVVAGRSLASVDETIGTVLGLLAGALPLLLLVLGATTWFVVGRALRPVDLLREEVDAVTASSLDRRVPDPGTDDEVGRLAHTMNRMLQRLDDSRRSQNRFISDASHELKSPLASLRQYAEVARAHPDRITADELSAAMLDEGARLEQLVQGMLVLARADERSLGRPTTLVDLDDIVFAEARRLRRSTRLTVDTSGVGAAQLQGDAGLLTQLVRNLVDNAIRHAESRVVFEVNTDRGGDRVTLVVDDDGEGIAASDRERVFDRFVRLDEARARDGGGSGLGLAIVREIAYAHGGSVRVESADSGGARFVVELSSAV